MTNSVSLKIIHRSSMLVKFTFFLIIVASLNTYSQDKNLNLPDLGDRVSGVVSLEQEKMIGQGFLEQVYSQAPLMMTQLFKNTLNYLYIDYLKPHKLRIETLL